MIEFVVVHGASRSERGRVRITTMCGGSTAKIYCIVEPLMPADAHCKTPRFVSALGVQRAGWRHGAKTIHLILDDVNRDCPRAGHWRLALGREFTVHCKVSWLNRTEIEAVLQARGCHGRDRAQTLKARRDRTSAWAARADLSGNHLALHHGHDAPHLPLQTAR